MIRTLGLLFMVLACLVAGCGNGREYDLRYPATLTVVNRSTTTLEVREIYSYPKSSHLFSLKGGVVAPEAQLEVRIAEGAYESVRQGTFFIDVNCSDVGNQKLDGRDLQRRAVHDQEQWSVTVYIQVCAGRTIERPDGVNGGQKPQGGLYRRDYSKKS